MRGTDALHHAVKVERKDICVQPLTVLCDEYGLDLGTPTRKRPKRSQEGVRRPRALAEGAAAACRLVASGRPAAREGAARS